MELLTAEDSIMVLTDKESILHYLWIGGSEIVSFGYGGELHSRGPRIGDSVSFPGL